jgi:hypothetical protein
MRACFLCLIGFFFAFTACNNQKEPDEVDEGVVIERTKEGAIDTVKKSIPAYIRKKTGPVTFHIKYHSPAVRGRIIWGGLVPFDNVWVTGAHSATSLEIDRDIFIGDKKIPAGKYAIFTIPTKDLWTFILNKQWNQHLADEYHEVHDVGRWIFRPDTIARHQERLMYDIDQTGEGRCNIEITWEKLRLTVPITFH